MPPVVEGLIAGLVGGVTAALVAWGMMRVEIRFLWRDLGKHEQRIEKHEQRIGDLEQQRHGHPRRRSTDFPKVRSD